MKNITFIDKETGLPFDNDYQDYLREVYKDCPNPITEGEIVVSFTPNEQP